MRFGLHYALIGSLASCSANELVPISTLEEKVSFKFDDFSNSTNNRKYIYVMISIDDSRRLDKYEDNLGKIEYYVYEFFNRYNIECTFVDNINCINDEFKFSIEVKESAKELTGKFFEIYPPKNDNEEYETATLLGNARGIALTRLNHILIDGNSEYNTWSPFRGPFSPSYIEGFEDLIVASNAATVVHEILHCCGLFHPESFSPSPVSAIYKLPNVMSYDLPNMDGNSLGMILSPLQEDMLHSYLSKGMTYRAFEKCNRNLDLFLIRIAAANGLKYE